MEIKGEFKVGFYAKIVDKSDTNFGDVGYVSHIDESPSDYDIITIDIPGKTEIKMGTNFDKVKIVLPREYAIELLSLGIDSEFSRYSLMSDNQLKEEICLTGWIHDDLIDSVFDDSLIKREGKIYDILSESGDYKLSKKALGFISGSGGNIRIMTDTANISGKKLSGILEECEFQIKVFPDGSVNFNQTLGDPIEESMKSRILNELMDGNITSYFGKAILGGYEFKNSDGLLCYLEVEYQKPIEKLAAIFELDNQKPSKKALDVLDLLFEDDGEEDVTKDVESNSPKGESIIVSNDYLKNSFTEMNQSKVLELQERIEKVTKDIQKVKFEVSSGEKKLKNLSDDLRVLNSRIESLTPGKEPNGIDFSVSEKITPDIQLDDSTMDIINKVSKALNLIPEKVAKIASESHHIIKLKGENIDRNSIAEFYKFDPIGKIYQNSEDGTEYKYVGDLSWHEIVKSLTRLGFNQVTHE